jgi:hypothetical protein
MKLALLGKANPNPRASFVDEPTFASADDRVKPGERARRRLAHRLTRECEAMTQYALSMGHAVPAEVMELLDRALSSLDTQTGPRLAAPDRDASKAEATSPDVPALVATSRAHAALAVIIAPATPEAVLAISDDHMLHPRLTSFGPVPIARQMLGLALVSLIAMLGVSLSPEINDTNMTKTLLDLSGFPLVAVELFLLSAGSLGSCFANLQRINQFLSEGTYDPKSQSTYWTRWVMGIISGIILSQLVYDVFLESSPSPAGGVTAPAVIGQPLLALLGGYSVDVVHSILNRLTNAVGSIFRGSEEGSPGSKRSLADANRSMQERLNTAVSIAAGEPVNVPAVSGRS